MGPVHDAAARPAREARPEWSPARVTDTDFRRSSMGQMHLDHARKDAMRSVRTKSLAGVRGGGLALDDLLGELDQHPPAVVLLQFAKHPQQP